MLPFSLSTLCVDENVILALEMFCLTFFCIVETLICSSSYASLKALRRNHKWLLLSCYCTMCNIFS